MSLPYIAEVLRITDIFICVLDSRVDLLQDVELNSSSHKQQTPPPLALIDPNTMSRGDHCLAAYLKHVAILAHFFLSNLRSRYLPTAVLKRFKTKDA